MSHERHMLANMNKVICLGFSASLRSLDTFAVPQISLREKFVSLTSGAFSFEILEKWPFSRSKRPKSQKRNKNESKCQQEKLRTRPKRDRMPNFLRDDRLLLEDSGIDTTFLLYTESCF